MKKVILFTTILFIFPHFLLSQGALDALRYARNIYSGTARSAAIGNAVTALGGDFGSLVINPAGSAVFPYSEFIFTPALHVSSTKSDYLSNSSDEGYGRLGITNIGYVAPLKLSNYSGITGISFGVGYNALNNFTDRISMSGVVDHLQEPSSWLASLASKTNGYRATDMDWYEGQNPFYSSYAPWRALLAWNTSLLDTIPGSGGREYLGATEALFGNQIGIPGSLRQEFNRKSFGNVGEYLFNFALNISQRFFVGFNLGIQSIYYETRENFSESAVNPNDFYQTQFNYFSHSYYQKTVGTGVNFKVGAIFLPIDNLRLGASISTPTWINLNEEWEESITAHFSDGYHQSLTSPLGQYEYKVKAPFRWNVGVAYTFGSLGAISVDYEQVAYDKIFMSSKESNTNNPFSDENSYITKEFTRASNFRAGLELNLNQDFSLRGGYAFYGNPEKSYGDNTQIASLGIGLHWGSFFSDLTFMQQFAQKENFSLYDNVMEGAQIVYQAPAGSQNASNWKVLMSIGFRF